MKIFNRDDVCNHNKKSDGYIIYNNDVYNVTEFIEDHPGGEAILSKYLGTDITDVFNDNQHHKHSRSALKLLETYKIGTLSSDQKCLENCISEEQCVVDFDRGILNQLHLINDKYYDWVYEPIPGIVKLFDSPLLESLTRCHWMAIPIIWLPIIAYFLRNYYLTLDPNDSFVTKLLWILFLTVLGIIHWTLLEYVLHRFVFHAKFKAKNILLLKFHFTIHGLHHKAPLDRYRLVFPPTPAFMIATLFLFVYHMVLGKKIVDSLTFGSMIGYVFYDLTHYYLHHGPNLNIKYFENLRSYHNKHHYESHELGFGISNKIWDYVFKTTIDMKDG